MNSPPLFNDDFSSQIKIECFQCYFHLVGQNYHAELSPTEEEQIESVTKKYPCLLVLGQTCYAKAFIVNQIFNKHVLPVIDYDEDSSSSAVKWRMIRFKYGEKNNIGLGIPGTSFELLDSLVAYKQPWDTIPEEDLEAGYNTDEEDRTKDVVLDVSTLTNHRF